MHSQGTPLLLRKCVRLWDIISVKMSISSNTNVKPACQLNLTLLQKRNRSHKDKTCGKNRPQKAEATERRKPRRLRLQHSSPPSDKLLRFQKPQGKLRSYNVNFTVPPTNSCHNQLIPPSKSHHSQLLSPPSLSYSTNITVKRS